MLAIQLLMHKDTVGAARSSYVVYHTSYSLTVADEDQMGEDFVGRYSPTSIRLLQFILIPVQAGFLTNLVSVFPSLATRPLYLMGESYGGTFIVSSIICSSNC